MRIARLKDHGAYMTEQKGSKVEVAELADEATADARKFRVKGTDDPFDAMNARGVPEQGSSYGPDKPNAVAVRKSAKALTEPLDDCTEWEVTVTYSDRADEDKLRQRRY